MNKNQQTHFLYSFFASFIVLIALAGCADEDMKAAPVLTGPYYPQLSMIEPPPPKYEQQPIIENPVTSTWRAGYWAYHGGGFDWVSGEVISRPSSTAIWMPSYWARREYGWAYIPGYWE